MKKLRDVNSQTKEDHLNASVADYRKTNRITSNTAHTDMGVQNGKDLIASNESPAFAKPDAESNKKDLFIGVAQTVYVDANNTMAVNSQVDAVDL